MSRILSSILCSLFALGVVALPWLLGGNLPPVRTASLGLMSILLLGIVFRPSLLGAPTKLDVWIKVLLLGSLGFVAAQTLLPFEFIQTAYPAATRLRICELILGVATFFVASSLFTNGKFAPIFFGIVCFNCVLMTFVGLAQKLSGTDKVLWFYELIHGGEPFGPFVNGNNAGGFLLLGFAASNYFLAIRIFRVNREADKTKSGELVFQAKRGFVDSVLHTMGREFASLQTKQLYAYAAIALIAAGIFATLSRGAAVSFGVTALVSWVYLFRKNWMALVFTVALVGVGIGFLAWTEQNEVIVANLETLGDVETASHQRLLHWQDGWSYAKERPIVGSGLGTYQYMYPMHATSHFNRWFRHAENQYLEAFAELGIVGISFLLMILLLSLKASLSLLKSVESKSRAIGIVGLSAIMSQIIAGAFDFGLYQPANSVLMAALVGIVFGERNRLNQVQAQRKERSTSSSQWLGWILTLLILVASAWATYEYSAVDARVAAQRFQDRFDPVRDREQVDFHQDLLEYSLKVRPDDCETYYHFANHQLMRYRLKAVDAMLLPMTLEPSNSSDAPPALENANPTDAGQVTQVVANTQTQELTDEQRQREFLESMQPKDVLEAWNRSTPYAIHRLSRIAYKSGPEFYTELTENEDVKAHLVLAYENLKKSNEMFDRYWPTHLRLAQLCCIAGEPERESEYCDRALEVCPNNSKSLYAVGLMKHHSGFTKAACSHWRKCLSLSRQFEEPIILLCRYEVSGRLFLEEVLPKDPYFRLRVAKRFFNSPEDINIKRILLAHTKRYLTNSQPIAVEDAITIALSAVIPVSAGNPTGLTAISGISSVSAKNLPEHSYPDSERRYLIGQIEFECQNYEVASVYLRKALEEAKHQPEWRLQYARTLIALKDYREAITQLKMCQLSSGTHHLATAKLLNQAKRLRIKNHK